MLAAVTAPPPTVPGPRRPGVPVEQPPRVIWPDGPDGAPVDVSGLDPDAFFEAITKQDRDRWDYPRLAAEAGRSVARVRKWVMNAYAHAEAVRRGEEPPPADDKTFIPPHGRGAAPCKTMEERLDKTAPGQPWWYAGEARKVLNMIGIMRRNGTYVPYKPAGRPRGAGDRAPRQRWTSAPARDNAPTVLAAYRELTGREDNPLTDRQARAELCRRFGLNRLAVSRRLAAALRAEADAANLRAQYDRLVAQHRAVGLTEAQADQEAIADLAADRGITVNGMRRKVTAARATTAPAEPDNDALRARYLELFAEQKAAGYSDRGASERARAALAAETGLNRRQLAARIAAAESAERAGRFDSADVAGYYKQLRGHGWSVDGARLRMCEEYGVTRERLDARLAETVGVGPRE